MTDRLIRVLVVDDHPEVRRRIARIIANAPGMECVATAADGREALDEALRTEPDIVLMDLRMPRVNGIDATQSIMAAGLTSRVIALTSLEDDDTFHQALQAGVSGFLLKSASRGELLHAIHEVDGGESILSPRMITRVLTRYGSTLAKSQLVEQLNDRERSLLSLVGDGLSNDEIAERLNLSPASVKSYVSRLLAKVGARDRAQLVVLAHRSGLVQH